MLSLLRVIKFAFQDMARNFGLSFMTVLILILMLLSINTLVVINVLTGEAVRLIKDQIDVSVYFSYDATDKEIQEIKSYTQSFPEVVNIDYFTREQVLEQFKTQHVDDKDVLAALNELNENPLGATMVIRTREPKDYAKIISALNVPEYENIIEAKSFGDTEKAIGRVHTITTNVEHFGYALSALFAVIALLIIFNTIRVAIYTQRIEIGIKKLVGATNWFVRGPYLVESLFFTCLSVAVTAAVVYFALRFLEPYVMVVFQKTGILTNYYLSHKMQLTGLQFIAVLFLTIFSSLLAMRRYLRV